MLNDRALSEVRRAIALDPNSASGYSTLADILNFQGKHSEALAAAAKATRLDPRNSLYYIYLQGQAYMGLERWQEAIPPLKVYVGRYPDNLWPHAWLALCYFNLRDHDSAEAEVAQLERIAALNPSALAYSLQAGILSWLGRPTEALAAVARGMRFDPQNPWIIWTQGWAYSQLGQWESALSTWKLFLRLYPENIGAHASLAGLYSALGQMDDARREAAEVERAVALDPDTTYGYRFLAMALNAAARPSEALAAATKAMRLYPTSGAFPPYPECDQGRAYTQLGRWNEAVRSLTSCLERHQTDQTMPRVALAVDYIELGQEDAARAEAAEIVRLNPEFSLKMALEGGFPTQRERAASDLSEAGLN